MTQVSLFGTDIPRGWHIAGGPFTVAATAAPSMKTHFSIKLICFKETFSYPTEGH